jgi:hypothetical protein
MVNVLIDMIDDVARQRAIDEITPPIQSALDAFNALTFRRTEAKPGEMGFLAYSMGEWLEIAAQIPEGGDEVIRRFLQQGEPEFTEVLPSRERHIALPNDVAGNPEIILFEFSQLGDELVLETRSMFVESGLDQNELISLIVRVLSSPHEWLKRRRQRDCTPKLRDLTCNNTRCKGECHTYKKSDEDRTRVLCTCIW